MSSWVIIKVGIDLSINCVFGFADNISIILVGGNAYKVIGIERPARGFRWAGDSPEADEGVVQILKWLAADYGYRLVRKSPSRRSTWNRTPYKGRGFSI